MRMLRKKSHNHIPSEKNSPLSVRFLFVRICGTFIFCALIHGHEHLSGLVTNNQPLCLTVVSFIEEIIMVGHAKVEFCALALLFPVLAFVSLAQSHGSYSTGFSFPSFGNNNRNQLLYMGNASLNSSSEGYIDLTPSPKTRSSAASNQTADQYSQMYDRIGRVLYPEPITVWPATFTTTFTMFVQKITLPDGLKNFNGDGLAFIIVPNDKYFFPDSYGSYLGVFDSSTDGNATNQLAIEFDTFKNEWDPNDNHVGIDINGIKSNETADFGQSGIDLKSGRPIRVRIHYDGWNKTLQIYAAYADRPISYAIVLNRTIELSSTVPRSAYLGFSASTGNSFEIHRIYDWSFSSEILPESSLNIAPIGGSRSRAGLTSRGLEVGLVVGSITVGVVLLGMLAWFGARTWKRKRGDVNFKDSNQVMLIQTEQPGHVNLSAGI